jgi:hypothetical protein
MDPAFRVLSALRARDSTWMKRRRKLDTATLFAILVQKRGHRGSIPEALHQLQLHDRANIDRDVVCRATPAAVTRALTKMHIDTFKNVHEELVNDPNCVQLMAPPTPYAPLCVSIDGCYLRIPPALAHRREGCAPTSSPHMLLTCAVDTRTDVILTYDVSYQPNERAALLRLVRSGRIPNESCIIADRGYFSAELWREINDRGMYAVMRVKRGANTHIELTAQEQQRARGMCTAGVPSRLITWSERHDGKLQGRLPRAALQRCGAHHMWMHDHLPRLPYAPVPSDWFLLTNTLLPPYAVVQLYVTRWRIETVHKTLKSTGMGLGKHRGNESTIMHAIAAAILEHLLLRIRELQATHHTRTGRQEQHRAWATSTSSEHHRQLVHTLMLHLPPVTPLQHHTRHDPLLHMYAELAHAITHYQQLASISLCWCTHLATILVGNHQPP